MGVVVSHEFNGVVSRDVVFPHEVSDLWIRFDFSGGFRGLSPGEAVSLRWGFSFPSPSGVSSVLGQVASLLVADEALAVSYVLHFFTWREVDLVYVHHVGIGARGLASWWNVTVSPSLEFPELYHIVVELSCLVKPLFPLPAEIGRAHV